MMTTDERTEMQETADQLAAYIEETTGDLEVHALLKQTRPTEVLPETSIDALRESMERSKAELKRIRPLLADFTVSDDGSVCLLTPQTPAADAWVAESLASDRMLHGSSVAIERRYIEPICMGIVGETDMVLVKDGMVMHESNGELVLRP